MFGFRFGFRLMDQRNIICLETIEIMCETMKYGTPLFKSNPPYIVYNTQLNDVQSSVLYLIIMMDPRMNYYITCKDRRNRLNYYTCPNIYRNPGSCCISDPSTTTLLFTKKLLAVQKLTTCEWIILQEQVQQPLIGQFHHLRLLQILLYCWGSN